jgi:hypothetical protein
MMQAQEGPEPYDYFCLLHDDIIPQSDWIEVLVSEIQRVEADVLAVVIPARDRSGMTMTGIAESADLWSMVRRLSIKEVHALPETFGQEILDDRQIFSTSTGCMIVDARKSWVLENQVCFRTMDSIVNHRGKWMAHTRTEDETFMRDVQRIGAKLCLTRKVELQHCDWSGTSNQEVFGQEVDERFFEITGKERP